MIALAGIDLGTLSARVKIDTQQAESDLNSFSEKAKQTGEKLTSVGAKMTAMGTVGTTAIAGLLKAGGDWQAQVAGTEFAMNNLDKTVQKAIESNSKNAQAIGLTTQQYKDGAVNISTYYKNMGVSAEETVKLSGATMDLVADLGAITDMPFDEALARFKSGLMGNYEALDAFNINISASSLETSEYVKSLGKKWNALSDNEKMMAVYNEIVRQGASAQGLARQEAEQFSMKTKLLATKIKELAGQIGETLIPIVEPLVSAFESIIDKVGTWVSENQELTGVILAVVGGLSAFLVVAGTVTAVVGAVTTVIGGLGLSAGAVTGVIAGLVASLLALVGSNEQVVNAIQMTINEAISKIPEWFNRLMEFLPQFLSYGAEIITRIISGVSSAVPNLLALLGNTMSNLLVTIQNNLPQFIEKGRQLVMNIINGLQQKIPQWLSTVGDGLVKVLGVIAQRLPEFITRGADIVARLVQGIANNFPQVMAKMGQLLGQVIAKIVEYLPQFLAKGLELAVKLALGLIEGIPKLLAVGGQLIQAVIKGVISGIGGLMSAGAKIVSGLLNGIKSAWGSLTSWVGGAISKLNPFKKSIEIEGELNGEGLPMADDSALFTNPMARGGLSSNPSLFGISSKRVFEPSKPKTYSTDKSLVQEAREYVINTVVELEGYQIAKASARYMQDELNALDRRATRLGGVL